MARSLLVAPVADHAALARTCLGLLRALDRQGVKVAFVKPVARPVADGCPDRSGQLVAAITGLHPPDAAQHVPPGAAARRGQAGRRAGEDRRGLGAGLRRVQRGRDRGPQLGALAAVRQLAEPGAGPGAGRRRRAGRHLARGRRRGGGGRAVRYRGQRLRGRRAGAGGRLRDPRPARRRCGRGGGTAGRPGPAAARRRRGGAVPSRADVAQDPRSGRPPAPARSCTRAICPGASGTWRCWPRAFPAAFMPWTPAGW